MLWGRNCSEENERLAPMEKKLRVSNTSPNPNVVFIDFSHILILMRGFGGGIRNFKISPIKKKYNIKDIHK